MGTDYNRLRVPPKDIRIKMQSAETNEEAVIIEEDYWRKIDEEIDRRIEEKHRHD